MSTTISVVENAVREDTLQWLALSLTPGLGPTRARRLVEHMGTVAAVFRTSLTELDFWPRQLRRWEPAERSNSHRRKSHARWPLASDSYRSTTPPTRPV